jgi:hypothetical protein
MTLYYKIEDSVKQYIMSDVEIEDATKASDEEIIAFDLEKVINKKLEELDDYHYNNAEIRQCKINNYFVLELSSEGRSLIQEQISFLTQQIELNLIEEASAVFEYFYSGGSIEINLTQLRQLYVEMLNIVNSNYQNYQTETYTIENLDSEETIESHDFTLNYLKNQNITLT